MDEIAAYYNQGREQARLNAGTGSLEQLRTQDILSRYLPPTGVILDVGGAAGIYALWLARLGHQVHLIDLMPLHIEQAQQAAALQPDFPLASLRQGDARHLDVADNSADAVLLLGPLYHLTERSDRVQAFREAYRVLMPGGQVFAATISRFASLMDGLAKKFVVDKDFIPLVRQALVDGQHRNPQRIQGYFTTAYFHRPEDVPVEVEEAGFTCTASLAVEGLASMDTDLERKLEDVSLRALVLDLLRQTEAEPTLLGASSHLITIGQKQS